MRIELLTPGFEGHVLEVDTGGARKAPSVYFDGAPAKPRLESSAFDVTRADGTPAIVMARRSRLLIDPIPQVSVDGRPEQIRRPMRWFEYLFAALPLLFAFFGPAGVGVGVVATLLNYRILRLPGGGGRWLRTLGVDLGAAAVVAVIAMATLFVTGATQEAAGDRAVQQFHSRLNAGDSSAILADADPLFTAKMSAADGARLFSSVQSQMGAVQASKLRTWRASQQSLSGASGTFLQMEYATEFTHGRATESFVWRIGGDRPRLAGYHLAPN